MHKELRYYRAFTLANCLLRKTQREQQKNISYRRQDSYCGARPALIIPRHYCNKQIPNPQSYVTYCITVAPNKGNRSSLTFPLSERRASSQMSIRCTFPRMQKFSCLNNVIPTILYGGPLAPEIPSKPSLPALYGK